MSDFVLLFRSTEAGARDAMGTPEQAQRSLKAWRAWMEQLESNGHLKDPGQPLERAGKIVRGAAKVVTDGPYAEAKDIVLGFIVIEARDMAHAVQLMDGCPIVEGGGTVEIRPVMSPPV